MTEVAVRALMPYKVCAYEPGAATIRDRATNETVGYVLATFVGWEAFLQTDPGNALPVTTVRYTDDIIVTITQVRTRAKAAERVWQAAGDDRD